MPLHPYDIQGIVCKVLQTNGAELVESVADCTHVILWHRQQPAHEEAVAAGKPAASPPWVFGCREAGRLLPPTAQVSPRVRPGF